ncbi:MAG: hypothetical protein R3E01_03485 [Pirellulaceae bacterium]|nr:hypothetical protein [Planctomycetales bacterium]
MIRKFHVTLTLGCVALALLLTTGCAVPTDQNVYVYVDNGRDESITVLVDNEEVATVPAGEAGQIKVQTGERAIEVKCNGQTVYFSKKQVEPSNTMLIMKQYMLNPDRQHRYLVYEVEYTTSLYDSLNSMAEKVGEQSDDAAMTAALADLQELREDIRLMPAADWFEIPTGVYVLEDSPDEVHTRNMTTSRFVLNRMAPDDYDYVQTWINDESPKPEDVEYIYEVVNKSVF